MAVGKSSLGRVANAKTIASASPEVAATVVPEVKPEKKKVATQKVVAGKIFTVGDELPEYLL